MNKFRTAEIENETMPFNNFHRKSIIKDIPPLYLYKSNYDDIVYISMKESRELKSVYLYDRDMKSVTDRNNSIPIAEGEEVILISETSSHMWFVTDRMKIYRYQKDGFFDTELLHDFSEKAKYYSMVTANDKHIIVLIDDTIYVIDKQTTGIIYKYEEIFDINEEYFINTKSGFQLSDTIKNNLITKDKTLGDEGSVLVPMFMETQDNMLYICCKNTYTQFKKDSKFIKELKHDYFLVVLRYEEEYLMSKDGSYINTKNLELIGSNYSSHAYKITDGAIPTCMTSFDKYVIFGIRNGKERTLVLVDIPKLQGTNVSVLNIDDYKRYGTEFKNANFTQITRDNVYIYAGSENGDVSIFNINDLNDDSENSIIITKDGSKISDQGNNDICYISGSEVILGFTGTDKFFLNNVCSGSIDYLYVDERFMYAASHNKHDITIYERTVKPSILYGTEEYKTYVNDTKLNICYKVTVLHDDDYAKFRYRVHLIDKENDFIVKDWSGYHKSGYKINDHLEFDIHKLKYYDVKFVVEIEDTNLVTIKQEHQLATFLDKECRMYNNKIVIPYRTVPDKDVKCEYAFYRLLPYDKLELVDKGEINVLSTHNIEWTVSVEEESVLTWNYATNKLEPNVVPHLKTDPVEVHRFDYIELPIPVKDEILYFVYTFKSYDEKWEQRTPNNGEYFIYDMSEFYRPKSIEKFTNDISVVDKFNILDLSYGPGIETVNTIMLRAQSGSTYKMQITSDGIVDLVPTFTLSENVADNVNLCFRVLNQDDYEMGFVAPDGRIWDFDVIETSNGRTTISRLEDEHLFLYRNDYDIQAMEEIVRALSNPVKSATIEAKDIDKYRLSSGYGANNKYYNNEYKLGYTMHTEGLAQETFKAHNHYFNVYIDGLKLPSKYVENISVDERGEYSVKFLYNDLDERYKNQPIEIELLHSDNIDHEKIIEKRMIHTEEDIEKLYKGEFEVVIPNLKSGVDVSEFKLFIEYPENNIHCRIDNCNYAIKRDANNTSKLYVRLNNYILNNIGCYLVITTVDVDKQLEYKLEGSKDEVDKYEPYYYVPLMKYDAYGNLVYYYTDDVKSIDVVVDGYTLMPNIDYMLVNLSLHSHMPTFVLFNDIIYPGSTVEIIFNDDVYDMITMTDNDSSVIFLDDGYNMFLEDGFSVFVEGKKLRKEQYEILDSSHLQLYVTNYKRVIVKFQYKNYSNLTSLIEILHERKANPYLIRNSKIEAPDLTYNSYLENIGYDDEKRIGKLYMIESHSDKCFKDEEDAIFDCNINDITMLDVNIDCGINYKLPYINNDIIIDCNACYNKSDFTLLNDPLESLFIEPEEPVNTKPVIIQQPDIKELDRVPGSIMLAFKVQDSESIFFDFEISLDGANYARFNPKVTGNTVFVYLDNLEPGNHTLQFRVSDGELNTETELINFVVSGIGTYYPIFNTQPKLLTPPHSLYAQFSMDAYEPFNEPMSLSVFINDREEVLGNFEDVVIDNKVNVTFLSYGDYKVYFVLTNRNNGNPRKSRDIHLNITENLPTVISEFKIDNIDHVEKYAIVHATINDEDTDFDKIECKLYVDEIEVKEFKRTILGNTIYAFIDNLKPGTHSVYMKFIDGWNIVNTIVINELIVNDLTLKPVIVKNINKLNLSKFGDLTFEYSVSDPNYMNLIHEISYNGFNYIKFKPVRYGNVYMFSGNIGTKLSQLANLSVRVTNTLGQSTILEYVMEPIIIPANRPIRLNPDIFVESYISDRINVGFSVINTDGDPIFAYVSYDDSKWTQVYPRTVDSAGGYKFMMSGLEKGKHRLRIKVSDRLSEAISNYVNFEL